MRALRQGFITNKPLPYCRGCELHYELPDDAVSTATDTLSSGPYELYIEPTILCNISCLNSTCSKDSGITRYRQEATLDFDVFTKTIDSLATPLRRALLYNYGEPLLHPRFSDMVHYLKKNQPQAWLSTSTNGLPLVSPQLRQRLVSCGLDELIFSIDGVDQDTYARYRRGGKFATAITNLRELALERERQGAGKPYLIWRYILFKWNDSDEQVQAAQALAAEIGVDRFCFEITDYPPGCPSQRFIPGTAAFDSIRHLVWGQARYTLSGSISLLSHSRVVRACSPIKLALQVNNTGRLPWEAATSYGIRHVSLGVSLLNRHGAVINRDLAHLPLPHRVQPGDQAVITAHIKAPQQRGRYRLRCDLVYEGVAWFSDLESPAPPRPQPWLIVI